MDAGLAAQDVAAGRFRVAWPGFLYLLWRAGGLPGLTRGEAVRILLASAGGVTAYHLALNEGERTTASGVAALIVALAPAATLADEPVTLWLLLDGALVIGGVAVAQRGTPRKAGMPPSACTAGADGQPCRP